MKTCRRILAQNIRKISHYLGVNSYLNRVLARAILVISQLKAFALETIRFPIVSVFEIYKRMMVTNEVVRDSALRL